MALIRVRFLALVGGAILASHAQGVRAQDQVDPAPAGEEAPPPAPVATAPKGDGDPLASRREGATTLIKASVGTVTRLKARGMLSEDSARQLEQSCTEASLALAAASNESMLASVEAKIAHIEGLLGGAWAQALEHRAASAESALKKVKEQLDAAPREVAKTHVEQVRVHVTDLEQRIANSRALLISRMPDDLQRAQDELERVNTAVASLEADVKSMTLPTVGNNLVDTLLQARCRTAICFNNGDERKYWLGIEPLVELPVGKSFGVGRSSLADYVNNHDLRVDLAAGLRVWFFRDVISVSVYISKALTDASVRVEGSPFIYPGSAVKRPYPGFALGFLYDSLWVGFDRDELHNGDADDQAFNPDFPPNHVVSGTWTITLALQPVTAFRAAIGTAVEASTKDKTGSAP